MKIKSIKPVESFPLYDICVSPNHEYVLGNGVICHNSGVVYSANTVLYLSKSKEKDGTEITGFTFKLKAEKSRFVKEGSIFDMNVSFEDGIDKYSDLFDFAIEAGFITSPSKGFYQKATKYEDQKKYRRSEFVRNDTPWEDILADEEFRSAYEHRYAL